MHKPIKILNSKLLPPRINDTISRERLHTALPEMKKKRLTTVRAGAGYGKTTLTAQMVEYLSRDTVWYRLDRTDRDFAALISYLIAGMSRYYPELGAETLPRLEEARMLTGEREALLTLLLSEIEKCIKRDLIIVLDDYHLVGDNPEIRDTLAFLIENLPPLIHLIIISRADTDIPLSRLIARREVFEIREADLVFSMDEIERLFAQLFDISLRSDTLRVLHQKTAGWVSGLILFYHSLKGGGPHEIEELLLNLNGSHRTISNYLEENVFELQPAETKEFLMKTSILSRINAEFCDMLLKIDNSNHILSRLEENHLFTFPFDEEREWYYYHHLFRDFLYNKLQHALNREAIRKLHRKTALLWERKGEFEEALEHYLRAEQFKKSCQLLRAFGRKWIKEGRLQMVISYLRKIPGSHLNREPWIQFTLARALEYTGRPQEAIRAYKRAQRAFKTSNIPKGAGLCQNALGSNYYLTGDFQRAEKRLKELLKQVQGNPRLCIDIMGNLIFITSHLGKMNSADRYFNDAQLLLSGLREKKGLTAWIQLNQGFRYGCAGEFIEALRFAEKTDAICQSLGHYYLLIMNYHLISWSCYYLGFFQRGLENAERGLRIAQEKGFRDNLHAWLLMDSALNANALDNRERAVRDGRESLELFQELGCRWGQAYTHHALSEIYYKAKNITAAEHSARSGIRAIEDLALPLEGGYLKGGLAHLLIDKGQWDEAHKLLEEAETELKKSKLNLSRVYLSYARFHWERKQRDGARNKLLSGLQLCEAHQYDVWVINEKQWIVPLLVELFAQEEMQDYIRGVVKKMGQVAHEKLIALQREGDSKRAHAAASLLKEFEDVPPPALRVCCLGRLRVFRGGEEIPSDKWKSKKARMLFRYLVTARRRGFLSKDFLIELLWPGENPEKTSNRFQVALTSLRKTLEPAIAKGESSYLLREDDSYRIHLGEAGSVDVDEFRDELRMARGEENPEKSISHYLHAEALYTGDFFEDDTYADWCLEEREALREEYLDALSCIMKHFEKRGDYRKCIAYAKEYLKRDIYAEEIYQRLMRYYAQTGNTTMVHKTFESCRENIADDLECPISRETEELYRRLASP